VIHLLLLLVLFTGGQVSAAMVMPMPQSGSPAVATQMPDMNCKACGATNPASGPCDVLCAALAAIIPGTPDLAEVGSRQDWTWQPRSGHAHSISPDTSPPRA
jgi:hypothetical protein